MEGLHFLSDVLFLYINQYTVAKLYKDINKKEVSLLILQKKIDLQHGSKGFFLKFGSGERWK